MKRKQGWQTRILRGLIGLWLSLLITQNAFAQQLAIHATQAEVTIWKQRAISGPYKDRWNVILSRANAFKASPDGVWTGQTNNSCWLGNPAPGRSRDERLRDSAFVYLLTGDASYRDPVRTRLLNQAAVAGTDFSNATKWCSNSEMNNVIELGPWLRRLVYAYDYIKPSLSAGDIATLDAWFLDAANYLNTKMDNRVKHCFPNYDTDDWTTSCSYSDIALTHYNGNMLQNGMGIFDNQAGAGMSTVAAIAVVLNNSTLKASAVRFVKGWLRIGVFPDGTAFDQARWTIFLPSPGDPGLGYSYAATAIGSFVSAADHLQRAGESIYEFSTSEGEGNTVGGPKSIGKVVKRLAEMQQHTINVYASDNATLTDCKRIDNDLDTSVCTNHPNSHRIVHDFGPLAQSNVFYNDPTVKASYSRTPPTNPTSGGYDPFSGDWGNYPDARFMFGQMEGKVFPYPIAGADGTPPSPPVNLRITPIP